MDPKSYWAFHLFETLMKVKVSLLRKKNKIKLHKPIYTQAHRQMHTHTQIRYNFGGIHSPSETQGLWVQV